MGKIVYIKMQKHERIYFKWQMLWYDLLPGMGLAKDDFRKVGWA